MATVTLDSIREAADKKYGSYDIEVGETTVRLLNPLRLTKEARDELESLESDELNVENSDLGDVQGRLTRTIQIIAETEAQANALLTAVGGDLAVLATIIESYGENAQVGEA